MGAFNLEFVIPLQTGFSSTVGMLLFLQMAAAGLTLNIFARCQL
jgi:hypothetical protein